MDSIYFDYNATTPVPDEVRFVMEPYFSLHFANPSSMHHLGRIPNQAMREAREHIARLLNAKNDSEIIFTSGGTESNNLAIAAALQLKSGRKKIITSAVEHSSILRVCRHWAKLGYDLVELGVDKHGQLDMGQLQQVIDDQTALVTLMHANNETGVIFPIEAIAKMVREKGALFFVDAVQTVGKISVDVQFIDADFVSISGHKFYGPKGAGALWVRSGLKIPSLILGGSQERGRRAGTENVPGIIGMGKAAEIVHCALGQESLRLKTLRDYFEQEMTRLIENVSINGSKDMRIPNTSNLKFSDIDAEALLIALDQKGICVSMGSACMSGANEPSHVLKAMRMTDDEARSSLRFSFGRFTNQQNVDSLIQETISSVSQLRGFHTAKS